MHKVIRYIAIFLLFVTLVTVRYFEGALFYDPLLHYFELGYLNGEALPKMNYLYLFLSITFRYCLNAGISLLILYLFFKETAVVKFSLLFYGSAFLVLITLYGVFMVHFDPDHYLRLFYVRRLLIQPVFVILLLPAFYYQKRMGE